MTAKKLVRDILLSAFRSRKVKPIRKRTVKVGRRIEELEDRAVPAATFPEFVDPNPATGNQFGATVVALSTGNVVITSPFADLGGTDAGAVYLFNGSTGALISTLVGGAANDRIGSAGSVTALTNGNYVIFSSSWDNGSATDAGAVTWGSGTTGVSGTVSAANSLVGSTTADFVDCQVRALTNGNYVVSNSRWDNAGITDAGAVTFGNGTTGVRGTITTSNSLVGLTASDFVGSGSVTELANGNYVVSSRFWNNGGIVDAGAVTPGSGTSGLVGTITASNSLVGSTANDGVGGSGVTALTNGNYVVRSPSWDNGGITDAGAVTFSSGTIAVLGPVTAANSLVGSTANDQIGSRGVFTLTNGNYVISSPFWDNGSATDAGAVTWGSRTIGVSGIVSASNSLVGSTSNDMGGINGGFVRALSNGNYVVQNPAWDRPGVVNAGAVTFGNGAAGVSGTITSGNSLVGSTPGDFVGGDALGNLFFTALSTGGYVVHSPQWANMGVAKAGAMTFGNGTTGVVGPVSATNSLVGTASDDFPFFNVVTALPNGNYVVHSKAWNNGAITDAGSVTFGSGTSGVSGIVTSANSLVGTVAFDQVGDGVTTLSNSNYVVRSSFWNNGGTARVGAATLGNGTNGVTGIITTANSLVGSTANDRVGGSGVTALTNGNYVVRSPDWDDGGVADAGAATFGSGTSGVTGPITTANSIRGSTPGDRVGSGGVTALTNGNYVVGSPTWDDGGVADAGALTFGNGSTGVTGPVTMGNSLRGSTPNDRVGNFGVTPLPNGNYVVLSASWDNVWVTPGVAEAGAVTFGNGSTGATGPLTPANSAMGLAANSGLAFPPVLDNVNSTFSGRFITEGGGRVRVGSQIDGFGTLSASLASGVLTVSDVAGKNNDLTISVAAGNLTIADANEVFGTVAPPGWTLSANGRAISIPVGSFSGSITVNSAGGNDTLTGDFSSGDPIPAGGITFNGGESSGDSDQLKLVGYSLTNADGVADVTANHTGAEAGSVVLAGLGTITFTQVESMIIGGVAVDLVIDLPAGPNANATLGDDGVAAFDAVNDANTSAIYDGTSPYSFAYTSFTNPSNSLKINRGSASDNLTVLDLVASGLTAGLAVGSAGGEFNQVTFAGPATLGGGKNLTVNAAGTINLPTSTSDLATSGSGAISLTTTRNISLASGASITTVNGNLSLSANQQATPTAGNFVGIDVNAGLIQAAGTGSLTVSGRGGTDGAGEQVGVYVRGGGDIIGGTSAATIVTGAGGISTGNINIGVYITGAGTTITSSGGNVSVTGTDLNGSRSSSGIHILSGSIAAGSGGSVTVQGTSQAGYGLVLVNSTVSSAGGNVSITGTITGAAANGTGLALFGSSELTAGGSGTMTVTGTGGIVGGQTYGVWLYATSRITSSGGAISVTGSGSSISEAIRVDATAIPIASGGTGNITITADSFEIADPINTTIRAGSSGGGTVTILPRTASTLIHVGGADVLSGSPLTLGLTNAELDRIFASTLQIGNVSSGTINVTADIVRSTSTSVNLTSGAAINFSAGSLNTAGGNVTLAPGTSASFAKTGNDVTAGTLGFNAGSDLNIAIGGAIADSQYQRLVVAGTVNLAGVDLVPTGSYVPSAYETFTIVSGTSRTGTFNSLPHGSLVVFNGKTLSVNYTPTSVFLFANEAPVATGGSDTTNEDASLSIDLRPLLADPETPSSSLTYTITTDPTQGTLAATGTAGVYLYTPGLNYHGNDGFQFKASDGFLDSNVASFSLTINSVNDVPSFTKGADESVNEDAGLQTVSGWATALNSGPADESGQALDFLVANDNPALFAVAPAIDSSGTLTYTPADDANGLATVTVRIHDNGGGTDTSAAQTFTITVNAVNDVPSFNLGSDQTVDEDSGNASIANWATSISSGPADEGGQTLTFLVSNDNNPLFSVQPSLSSTGTLSFTPAADAFGSTTVTVLLQDSAGGTSAAQEFTIDVAPVNDAPSFTGGGNISLNEDPGTQSIPNWATAISKGPANESDQNISFDIVSNSNPALFLSGPTVAANGTLSFETAANAFGTATIEVEVSDDGGGSNVGNSHQFTIDIAAQNDAPITQPDNVSVKVGKTVTIPVLANDSDIELGTLQLVSVTTPTHGSVRIVGNALVYTPKIIKGAVDTFDYSVSDSQGGSSVGTVSVTILDVTPPKIQAVRLYYGPNSFIDASAISRSIVGWDRLYKVAVVFSEEVLANPNALTFTRNGVAVPTTFTWDLTTRTAIWTPIDPIVDGRTTIRLSASGVADTSGNLLAKDWVRAFGLLAGDFDGNGIVNKGDLRAIKKRFTKPKVALARLADVDGNGIVNQSDLDRATANLGRRLK